eukprot:8117-Heterococcus_DN1.PRE.1
MPPRSLRALNIVAGAEVGVEAEAGTGQRVYKISPCVGCETFILHTFIYIYCRIEDIITMCKASQAHEESCVSNGLRMYAAKMVIDQGHKQRLPYIRAKNSYSIARRLMDYVPTATLWSCCGRVP